MKQTLISNLQNVLKPIDEARGLPNDAYINEDYFTSETKTVFANNWFAIGFGKDVPEAGCVMPVDFMDIPFLVTRNREGVINVFQNVCRHRGMKLVEAPARLKGPITCPYHAWAYDLDGQLRATPHAGGPGIHNHESVPCSDLPLLAVRSYVWRDVIYVTLDEATPPFEIYAADLMARWSEFEQPVYSGGTDSGFMLDLACNWKLGVENYCEAYHLPFIHPDLNSYSRLEDHYNILDDESYAGQGSDVYNPQIAEDGRQFPSFANLSSKWDKGAEYCAFFPNVLLGVHHDHAFAIILTPAGPERTIERIELYYASEEVAQSAYDDMRAVNTAMWKKVFEEDIIVVEGMQKGRHAPLYDGGKFSSIMDTPTHHFHKWVAHNMLKSQ
ncbi:MAG: aromatic ring-hydroxylating oxygenase subunit alpha [Candidatus Puniceispirillaceae bacterium]